MQKLTAANVRGKMLKGFTLIELLVVIAIIALLASIILASLNSARNKGNDATVKGNLDAIRTQAELYATNNNGYGSALATTTGNTPGAGCLGQTTGVLSDPTIKAALLSASKAGPNGAGNVTCSVNSTVGAWWVSAQLLSNSALDWCVSSVGIASSTNDASPLTAGNSCP